MKRGKQKMSYNIKVHRQNENAILPTKGSDGAAGYDLYIPNSPDVTEIKLFPNDIIKIDTGISMNIPQGYWGGIYIRSSVGTKRGLEIVNKVGVIDSDYTGNIIIALRNYSHDIQVLTPGERIAQLIIQPYLDDTTLFEVDKLDETKRGSGGFGSTGKL